MIGVALLACASASTSEACTVHKHTHTPMVVHPSACTLSFVCSFHAAAGTVHTPFGGNEIHDSDSKVAQQGKQTRDYVCKFLVVQGCYIHGNCLCVCVNACVHAMPESCVMCASEEHGKKLMRHLSPLQSG